MVKVGQQTYFNWFFSHISPTGRSGIEPAISCAVICTERIFNLFK